MNVLDDSDVICAHARETARPRAPTFEEIAHSRGLRRIRGDLWLVAPGIVREATTLEELEQERRAALAARGEAARWQR